MPLLLKLHKGGIPPVFILFLQTKPRYKMYTIKGGLTSSYPEIQKFSDLEISGFQFGNEIFFLFNKEIE